MTSDNASTDVLRLKIVTRDWPDLKDLSSGFLVHLREHYNAQVVTDRPDILLCENRSVAETAPLKIFITGENTHPSDERHYDIILGVRKGEDARLYPLPHWTFAVNWSNDSAFDSVNKLTAEYRATQAGAIEKTLFCGFVCVHARPSRVRFVNVLSAYRKVSCPGRVLNNMQPIAGGWENKIKFLNQCKFTVAFENDTVDDMSGYVTEKIIHAFLAGTIPIYYGAPDIGEVFNKAAFLDRRDFASDEALAQRVAEIDKDDVIFKNMLKEPVFVNNTIPTAYYPHNICAHIMSKLGAKRAQ